MSINRDPKCEKSCLFCFCQMCLATSWHVVRPASVPCVGMYTSLSLELHGHSLSFLAGVCQRPEELFTKYCITELVCWVRKHTELSKVNPNLQSIVFFTDCLSVPGRSLFAMYLFEPLSALGWGIYIYDVIIMALSG